MLAVLIVEDDPMVAELNRRYLEQLEGYRLAGIAGNGEEALRLLQQTSVDVVLLDVFMPGMNGLELLQAIRQAQHGVDVILVTAAHDAATVEQALRQGVVDYLIKPFEFSRFQAALLNYRRRHESISERQSFCQQDLDKQFFAPLPSGEAAALPKGLDRNTIRIIWEQIIRTEREFSADEIAGAVGLSQVSMRKYLKYLQGLRLISAEVSYGAVGRPLYKYRCINKQAKFF